MLQTKKFPAAYTHIPGWESYVPSDFDMKDCKESLFRLLYRGMMLEKKKPRIGLLKYCIQKCNNHEDFI